MNLPWRIAGGALWLAAMVSACSGGSARSGDSGRPDGQGLDLAEDGTSAADAGAEDASFADATPGDAAPDATLTPPSGRRSFVVTSTLTLRNGMGMPASPFPAGHVFTMVLDFDARIAIVGSADGNGVVPFAATATGVSISQVFSFGFGSSTVSYLTVDVTVAAGGESLSGTGQGHGSCVLANTDVGGCGADVAMSLQGVRDTQPPSLSSSANGTMIDAFDGVTLTASEPLPPDTRLVLADLHGDQVSFAPRADETTAAFIFDLAGKMWRYGEQYTVSADSLVDFAGNGGGGTGLVSFTTGPPPPLVAEDGFESATGATLGGAQVLSGADAPVISGALSLYMPPLSQSHGRMALALRLTLAPGDTVVRFSFRTVNAGGAQMNPYYLMGSVGGQIVSPQLPSDTGPTTIGMINQAQVSLGPIMTAEWPLPADASGEIALTRIVPACCPYGGLPPPPVAGLIIDDLRVE